MTAPAEPCVVVPPDCISRVLPPTIDILVAAKCVTDAVLDATKISLVTNTSCSPPIVLDSLPVTVVVKLPPVSPVPTDAI